MFRDEIVLLYGGKGQILRVRVFVRKGVVLTVLGAAQLVPAFLHVRLDPTQTLPQRLEAGIDVRRRLLQVRDSDVELEHHGVEGAQQEHALVVRLFCGAGEGGGDLVHVEQDVVDGAAQEEAGHEEKVRDASARRAEGGQEEGAHAATQAGQREEDGGQQTDRD